MVKIDKLPPVFDQGELGCSTANSLGHHIRPIEQNDDTLSQMYSYYDEPSIVTRNIKDIRFVPRVIDKIYIGAAILQGIKDLKS